MSSAKKSWNVLNVQNYTIKNSAFYRYHKRGGDK